MAENNTESTAVNQLIELVATQKPLPPDPSEDLMFKAAPASPRRPKGTMQVSPPRITATVPPMRAAGEVEPLPRARAPIGTQQGLHAVRAMPPAVPQVRISTAPPARPVSIPPVVRVASLAIDHDEDNEVTNPEHDVMSRVTKPTLPPPVPPVRAQGSAMASRPSIPTQSFDYPIVKHPAQALPVVAPPIATPVLLEDQLVTSTSATSPALAKFEAEMGTHQVAKVGDWTAIIGRLITPMVVLVIIGIFVGGYFAFDGDGGKSRKAKPEGATITMPVTRAAVAGEPAQAMPEPAPVAPLRAEPVAGTPDPASLQVESVAATPVPAPVAPAVAAEPEPARAQALVDIRVDSSPSGATVNLIDRGKSMYLGTTPLAAAVDPSRKYELVFSYENRATVIEALDPATQKHVSVRLARAEAPRREHRHRGQVTKPSAIDAAPAGAGEPAKAEPAAKPDAGGEGTLMISTKPPCEIVVDGKPTGLTTPQRSIPLAAGAHKITLVNGAEGIKKTVSVQITADKPTKVIQDFLK